MEARHQSRRKETSDSLAKMTHRHLQARPFDALGGTSKSDISAQVGLSTSAVLPIQPKLTVGQPDDKYEQEADRVAAQVVQAINNPPPDQGAEDTQKDSLSTSLQRRTLQCKGEVDSGPVSGEFESSLNRARSGGNSLQPQLRRQMESAMGADFSSVKVHTDAQSNCLSQSIQAKAFTTGNDVFFKQGEYNPGTRSGQALIAHELTHVTQQNPGVRSAVVLQRDIDYDSFKKSTKIWNAARGNKLRVIDHWLEIASQTQDSEEKAEAQQKVIDACDVWLEKHHGKKDEKSVRVRRPKIQILRDDLQQALGHQDTSKPNDSKPDYKHFDGNYESFIKSTKVWHGKRGENLAAIDTWLKVAWRSTSNEERKKAQWQTLAACDFWLENHHKQKDKKSVEQRRPKVETLKANLREALGIEATREIDHDAFKSKTDSWYHNGGHLICRESREQQLKTIDQCLLAASKTPDRKLKFNAWQNAIEACDNWLLAYGGEDSLKNAANRASASKRKLEVEALKGQLKKNLEIAAKPNSINDSRGDFRPNSRTNITKDWNSIKGVVSEKRKGFQESSIADKREKIAGATGSVGKGVGMTVKGVEWFADKAEYMPEFGGFGDLAGGSGAIFSHTLLGLNRLYGIAKSFYKYGGEDDSEVILEGGSELAKNVAGMSKGFLKVGRGGIKVAGQVAATSAALSTAAMGVGAAAGAVSMIVGLITAAQGGYSIIKGLYNKGKIKAAEKNKKEMISGVNSKIEDATMHIRKNGYSLSYKDIDQILDSLRQLGQTLESLRTLDVQYAPAIAAAKKIGNRRMESGALKAASGLLAVGAGGAAVIGAVATAATMGSAAPIVAGVAIGAGIAIGITSLGFHSGKFAHGLRRGKTASGLATIAKRIGDDGIPKSVPDADKIDYRSMERRVYQCYYKHMPQVLEGKKPAGLSRAQFDMIKTFTWEEKKNRVKNKEKIAVKKPEDARCVERSKNLHYDSLSKDGEGLDEREGLSYYELTKNWIEVRNKSDKKTHREKPGKLAKFKHKFSASAHKSSTSMKASKEEIAIALIDLCRNSYDHETEDFTNIPVKITGSPEDVDQEVIENFGEVTSQTLLSVANVTGKKWKAWTNSLEKKKKKKDFSVKEEINFLKRKIMNNIKI